MDKFRKTYRNDSRDNGHDNRRDGGDNAVDCGADGRKDSTLRNNIVSIWATDPE